MIKASQIQFNVYSNKSVLKPIRQMSLQEFIYLHKKLQDPFIDEDTPQILTNVLRDLKVSNQVIEQIFKIASSRSFLLKERIELKKDLPAIIASTLNDRTVPMDQCVYSGYIIIDIDYSGPTKKEDLGEEEATNIKSCLKSFQSLLQEYLSEDEYKALLISFISPTGTGLKLLFAADFEENKYNPELVQAFYKNLEKAILLWKTKNNIPFDFSIDIATKNINRLCFILFTDGIELHNYEIINKEYYFDIKPLKMNVYKNLIEKSQILTYEEQKELKEIEDRSLRRLQEFYILASKRFPNRLSFERGNRNNSIYFYSVLVYSYDKIHNKRPTPIEEVVEICTQIMERIGSLDHTLRDDEIRRTVESAKNSVERYGILHEDIRDFCKGYRPMRTNSVEIKLDTIETKNGYIFLKYNSIEEFQDFLNKLESKLNKTNLKKFINKILSLYFEEVPHICVEDNSVYTYYKVEGAFCIPYNDPRTLRFQSTKAEAIKMSILKYVENRIFFENMPEDEAETACEVFKEFIIEYLTPQKIKDYLSSSRWIKEIPSDKLLHCFTNVNTHTHFYPLTKEYFIVVSEKDKTIQLKHYTEFEERLILSQKRTFPFEYITRNLSEDSKKTYMNKIKEIIQNINSNKISLDDLKNNTYQGKLASLLFFGELNPDNKEFEQILKFLGFSACPSTTLPNKLIIFKDIASTIHDGAQGGTGKSTFIKIFYEPYIPFSPLNSISPKGFPLSNLKTEDMAWIGLDTTESTNAIFPLIKNIESNEPIFKEEKFKNQEVISLEENPKRVILIGNHELQLPMDSTTSRKIVVVEVFGLLRKYHSQFSEFKNLKNTYTLKVLSVEEWLKGFTFFFSSIKYFLNNIEEYKGNGIDKLIQPMSRTLIQTNIKHSKGFISLKRAEEKKILELIPHIKALIYEKYNFNKENAKAISQNKIEADIVPTNFSLSNMILIIKEMAKKRSEGLMFLGQDEIYIEAIKEFLQDPLKKLKNYTSSDILSKLKEEDQQIERELSVLQSNKGEGWATSLEEKLFLEAGAIKEGNSTYYFDFPIYSRLKILVSAFSEYFEHDTYVFDELLRSNSGRSESRFITLMLYLYGKKHKLNILNKEEKGKIIYKFISEFIKSFWPTVLESKERRQFFMAYLLKNFDLDYLERYLDLIKNLIHPSGQQTKEELPESIKKELEDLEKFFTNDINNEKKESLLITKEPIEQKNEFSASSINDKIEIKEERTFLLKETPDEEAKKKGVLTDKEIEQILQEIEEKKKKRKMRLVKRVRDPETGKVIETIVLDELDWKYNKDSNS